MTHPLDTSALLTHYPGEAGAAKLELLIAGGRSKIAVSVITRVDA